MKTIVTYSMGICSAYIAVRLQENCEKPLCLWPDTQREDEDTYRFGREVVERWGLEIVEASDGRDLWEVFRQEKMIPARQIALCSIKLKIRPRETFLDNLAEPSRVAYGYDPDESGRAAKLVEHWKHERHTPWFPLIEWGVSKPECFGFFEERGIKPPRMYQHFQHANCLPRKNFKRPDWIALRHFYPEKFAAAQQFEDNSGLRWMQDGPYLRDLPLAETPHWNRRKKRDFWEPAFTFDMPCGACAVD